MMNMKKKDILICTIILIITVFLGIWIGYTMYLLAGPIEKKEVNDNPIDTIDNSSYYFTWFRKDKFINKIIVS